jgi:purine catabolism regulator
VRALSAAIGGAVTVLDGRGEVIATRAFRREITEAAEASLRKQVAARSIEGGVGDYGEFAPDHPDVAGRALAMPVFTRGQGPPQAWLAAARDAGGLGDFERLILQQAATVVALELMRQRAMRDTERRLAGDVLAETLTGGLAESEVESRLRPFGVGADAAVLVFAPATALFANGSADDKAAAASGWVGPDSAEAELDRFLRDAGIGALVAIRDRLLCAVVDAGGDDFDGEELARRARSAMSANGSEPLRAAASRAAPVGTLRRTFHEARCALEAVAMANGSAPDVGSYRDLGAFQLLLSLHDDEALRLYCDSVLGPLENGGGEYGDELIRSLEAFIEQNGQWEKAARQLYCHRHTLRYRIRRVEELTGRDLKSARDRIEFWLALRARELV